MRRVVRLEPGGLVGRQRERRGVRLAEPERRERREDPPDLLDDRTGVAARQGPREEPQPGLGHPLDVAEGPPGLVGLVVVAPGETRDHLDDLLVEHHHAVRRPEDRPQVGMQVAGHPPALLGLEVGRDHVALDRPGPEQRDVGDDVLKRVQAGLADQLALTRRLDLEAAEGLRLRDHLERRRVVEGHLHLVVEVEAHSLEPRDLVDRVRHRRLHPDAEHVELEQPEVLDVVLVELAHREPGVRRLHRRAVEQGRVGEQHPAGVHGDVPGQAVEPLHEPEQQVEPSLPQPRRPQLGQVAQRDPGVAGPDVRERLGDRVDLADRHAERGADVAHRVPDAVGVHHRDAHAALAAVAVQDRLVDLEAARGLDVDVDVGQRLAPRGEEPLHQQVVAQRVDPGDAEQVVDQAAGSRPAGRAPHAHVLDQVGDVRDGQEVRRVAERADGLQLVVEPLPDPLPRGVAEATPDARLAPGPQRPVGGPVPDARRPAHRPAVEGELREVHLAQAQVAARVEGAAVRHHPGAREQPVRLPVAVPQPREPADLLGHLGHLLPGLQEPLGVGPRRGADVSEISRAEGDQAPGGVEDVDRGRVRAVRVADRVAEHRTEPGRPGQAGHPGGVRRRGRTGPGQPVGDQLEEQVGVVDHLQPRCQRGPGEVLAAGGHGLPHLGARPEQHQHVVPGDVLGHQVEGAHRLAALARQVGGGDQPADRGPAPPADGQEGHPGQQLVAERTAARRGAGRPDRTACTGRSARPGRRDGEVHPEDGAHPALQARLGEPDRAVGAVPVGQGEGVHLLLDGPLDQHVRVRGAVLQGVAGRHVQVHERIRQRATRPPGQARAASSRGTPRPARGTGRRRAPGRRPPAR